MKQQREVNKRYRNLLNAIHEDCVNPKVRVTSLRPYTDTYGVASHATTVMRRMKTVAKENGQYVWRRRVPDSTMANTLREKTTDYFRESGVTIVPRERKETTPTEVSEKVVKAQNVDLKRFLTVYEKLPTDKLTRDERIEIAKGVAKEL